MMNNFMIDKIHGMDPGIQPFHLNQTTNVSTINFDIFDDEPHNVLLYIDNSNIFESARKYSAKLKGYLTGIIDVACRINYEKLVYKAVAGRELLYGKAYGSEPQGHGSLREAITKKGLQVKTFERSKWTRKEKEVDGRLIADAVEDIVEQKERAGENRTVILFSGDRDLIPVVEKATKHGYSVEIWSFEGSMNNDVIRKAKSNPEKISIFYMESIFKDVSFTERDWEERIPPERSLVATVNLPHAMDKRWIFKYFVKKAEDIFKVPMSGKYIDNYKHIVLVPCIAEIFTPRQACKECASRIDVRTWDFYKHIMDGIPELQSHFGQICVSITTWKLFIENHPDRKSFIEISTRFQPLQTQDQDDDDDDDEDDQKETAADDNENLDDNILVNDLAAYSFYGPHEITSGDFITHVRKSKPKVIIRPEPCTHKFWCLYGLECYFKHTDEERMYFRKQPDANLRKRYKTKPCNYHAQSICEYTANGKPYLCGFAHGLADSRCLCCGGTGNGEHWMDDCPNNRNNV